MKCMMMTAAMISFTLLVAGTRAADPELDKQILGAWTLELTTPDGEQLNPTIIVGRQYDDYVAWRVDKEQVEPFKKVQIQGEKLVATIQPQERPGTTVTLEAGLSGENRCEGTGTYRTASGETGNLRFRGKRAPLSSFEEIMTWKLDFVTPDGQRHTPTILVLSRDGQRYGWYSGEDHELPTSKLNVNGDRVELTVAGNLSDGAKVKLTFRGTVNGDRVAGTADYDVDGEAGSFSFTGQRAS